MELRYSLRTLGSLGVDATDDAGATVPVLASGKPAALLSFLALAPGRSVLRDELVDLLWAHVEVERARLSLRQALFQLRSTIGHDAIQTEGRRVVLTGELAVDLLDFRCLAEDERVDALDRYAGGFLDGVSFPGSAAFEQWAERERARTDALLLRCAECCVNVALEDGKTTEALRIARRVRDFLPREQESWRLLLDSALATGDRLLAIVEGDVLAKWLRDEGLEPSDAVARTLRQLQRATADSPRPLPAFESEFVGREGDLTALLRAYHQVASGRPRHVHVIAPAGLGKSRLLAECAARCRLMRGRVVSIAALPSDRGLSFALQARLVAALGALPGAIAVAPASAAVLVRLAPTLSSRFEVSSMASAVPDDALTRSQVVRELIETVAAERMLVLMVDDLHWGDGESLAALQRIAEQLPPNLLLVTATRPPIALGGVSSSSTRELAPLTDSHVRDMLVTLGLPADAAATAPAVQAITEASAGSPLYVLQLVRQGLEDGWLRRDGERLLATIDEDARALSGLDPIAGRLRELSEGDARVLRVLARAGMPLDEQMLGAVVGANVDDSLERLAARGLVTPTSGGWTCAHDVIAEHVVSRSAADELRSMDAALGRELARTSTGTSEARRAARFLADGGDMGGLRDLVAQQLQAHRDAGRDVAGVAMARELVGPSLPDEQIATLVASLPMRLRIRRRTARLAAASMVFAVALMAVAASRQQVPSLIDAQRPLGSTQALTDSSLLELRPALVVEQRDGRGRLVANDGDTIDVTLRDTVSGESRTTTQTMTAGRVTFERLRGANVRAGNAVVRRRDSGDSLLVRVRWGDDVNVRLRLKSFRVGDVEVVPRHPSLRVPPGADVSGVLTVEYASHFMNETLVYAWTPTWGTPATEARRFGMLSTPTEWRSREDPLTLTAPEAPGEYFIVVLAGAEEGEHFLLSGTNWVMREPTWGDGNDVADWPRETLRRVVEGRDVPVHTTTLRMTEGRRSRQPARHYPIAIRIVVDANARTVSAE